MLLAILVIAVMIASQNMIVGYKTAYEYEAEPKVSEFESLDDAMEYAELRKTGWKGSIDDFYKWRDKDEK